MAEIIPFSPQKKEQILLKATQALKKGQIVAIPTETYYGLATNPFAPEALQRLFQLKGRPLKKPVPILIARQEQLWLLAREISPLHRIFMERFWPGPLTLIFFARPDLPSLVTGGTGKVAVRLTSHPLAQELAALFGPITGTSANLSGNPPAIEAKEILDSLPEVDLILDAGPCPGGAPSTILDLTVDPPEVLRPGKITQEEIQALFRQLK